MNKPLPLSLVLLLSLAPLAVQALPDDREQPIDIEALSSELLMDEGLVIYRGNSDDPAVITQGSLRISGEEITLTRRDGVVQLITVTGSPARFQQQPELDQAVVHGSGLLITYDSPLQLLTLEEEAQVEYGGNILNGYRVEYDMTVSRVNAQSRDDNDRINVSIQPDSSE